MVQIYKLFQFKCKLSYFKSNFSFSLTKMDNKDMVVILKNSCPINGHYMFKKPIFAKSIRCP